MQFHIFNATKPPSANFSKDTNLHLLPCETINIQGVSRSVVAKRIINDLLQSQFYDEHSSFFKLKDATPQIENELLNESCFLANAPCALPEALYKAVVDHIAWKLCTPDTEFSGNLHKACGVSIDELANMKCFKDTGFSYTEQNGGNFLNENTMCKFLKRYYCSSKTNFTTLLHIINIPNNFGHLIGLCGEGTADGGISRVYVIDKTQKFNSPLYDKDRQASSTDITAYLHAAGDPEHTRFFVLLASGCREPMDFFEEPLERYSTVCHGYALAKSIAEPAPPGPPPFKKSRYDPGHQTPKMDGGAPLKNKSKRKRKRRSRRYKKNSKIKKSKKKRLPKRRTTRRA
jgi:hypothetical protein